MTKSLLVGIAICTTLAVFGGASAGARKAHTHKAHNTHKTSTTSTTGTRRSTLPDGPRANNDPIYESCEYPWRHLDVGCPYGW
jgi:hypothetical protein